MPLTFTAEALSAFPKPNEVSSAFSKFQKGLLAVLRNSFSFTEQRELAMQLYPANLPYRVPARLGSQPRHLVLTYLRNLTDDVAPTAGVFVDWVPEEGAVKLRSITGLTSGKLYELRFMVYD